MKNRTTVIVMGGGVAGMSAAHELIKRGFEVKVLERNMKYCGGKARSVNVPKTNLIEEDKYLPGEHGFRFFPGFYKHVTQTMKEIPYYENGKAQKDGCFGNLVHTDRIMLARYDNKEPIVITARFPSNWKDFALLLHDTHADTGLTKEEIEFFAKKIWQLMSSSQIRREMEYERIGWWDYLEADRFSKTYQTLLVEGLTRTLVAAQARTASTKTGGDIFLQLIFNMAEPGVNTDRVLNGPTNEKWLNPWLDYLKKKGVNYLFNHEVVGIKNDGNKISHIEVKNPQGDIEQVKGDYYILATPVERAAPLINEQIREVDKELADLDTLAMDTNWMNGLQFYLNEDVKITEGHVIYSDSEWAVTSISQIQFWKDYDLTKRFNGKVKGILSVDVSDWTETRFKGKLAAECSTKEIAELAWEQIEKSLNVDGKKVLDKSMIEHYYVDRDISWDRLKDENIDKEPLLVNKINTWELRPNAFTKINNLMLASDYVRTYTDLATMEGANEAARRAVNNILDKEKSREKRCEIWPMKEPWFFIPLKRWDHKEYKKGREYSIHPPLWLRVYMFFWGGTYLLINLVKAVWYELFGNKN